MDGGIGLIFYYIFSLIKCTYVGIGFAVGFAAIGFAIGTFKVPESTAFEVTRKAGGADIDEVILRYIKFYDLVSKKEFIYILRTETNNDFNGNINNCGNNFIFCNYSISIYILANVC